MYNDFGGHGSDTSATLRTQCAVFCTQAPVLQDSGLGKAAITLYEAIPQTHSRSLYLSTSCEIETAL